jgi:peptidoglycan/LPS O-acetylase OafA/YrhL
MDIKMKVKVFLSICLVQVFGASLLCQAEWGKVLASSNPATSFGPDYSAMAAYGGYLINNLGNFEECNKIATANYVVLVFNELLPKIVQTYCGPSVCTEEDYKTLVLPYTVNYPILDVVFPYKYQQDTYNDNFTPSAIALLLFISILGAIGIAATACEYFRQKGWKKKLWYKLLTCFSAIKNVKLLFLQRSEEKMGKIDTLELFNCVKVLSVCWVIVGHAAIVQFDSGLLDNYSTIQNYFIKSNSIIMVASTYAVDAIFWVSGFLMSYFFLIYLEKTGSFSILSLLNMYLYRYIRITPALLFAILFYMSLGKYIGSGPLFFNYDNNSSLADCHDWAFTNIIYLNNFVPENKGNYCLSHTWYLAADMQYFIVFPIVLIIYAKVHKAVGWVLLVGLVFLGPVSSGIIADHYHFNAGLFLNTDPRDYQNYYYIKPYTRTPPYALAVASGVILYSYRKLQENKVIFDRFANAIAGAFSNLIVRCLVFLLGVSLIDIFIFSQYDLYSHPGTNFLYPATYYKFDHWTDAQNTAFVALERLGYGLGLTFIFLPLLLGYFPKITQAMSHAAWSFIGRLTFVMYLIHYPFIFIIVMSQRSSEDMNTYNVVRDAVFYIALSIVASIPIVLLIEYPMVNLAKRILNRREKRAKVVSIDSKEGEPIRDNA